MKMSPIGILVVLLGLVVGIVFWTVGYQALPNNVTHKDISKDNKILTSVKSTGNSTSSSAGQAGSSSSNGAGSSSLPTVAKIPASKIKFTDTSMPGYKLFEKTCASCHGNKGEGAFGPPIYAIGKYWNTAQLTHFVENPKGGMPKNGNLQSTAQVQQVVNWLVKQKASGGN
ncbi:cytochrome c [Alicyclobacillus sp. SO9]|uniref:c-type cytochrome n=1 Tax=Alicyclobacillus sp. SO9 TaxID=2665646 RepID=UPI0018E86249|nr:cytochrome c [Alicyclobacillus sp. SO9]QQE77160.1 cytochrome c [Alicyclobacillus sp. SO9]